MIAALDEARLADLAAHARTLGSHVPALKGSSRTRPDGRNRSASAQRPASPPSAA